VKIDVDKLHTTELGTERIRHNLSLETDDVVAWCKRAILDTGDASVSRKGKNWYVQCPACVITVNANNGTLITAHRF